MADDVDRPAYCQICGEGGKRYRCPRCFIETCSLKCVKQHKIDNDCNGIRNKTGMVRLKDFTDLHLLSDYRFIEDASRCVDTAERNMSKKRGVGYWTGQLLRQCKYRGIRLQIMPEKFSKRTRNTTKYIQHLKKIFWHVEWKFAESDVYIDEKISERVTLRNALSKYIDQMSGPQNSRLKPYKSTGVDDVAVIMKLEYQPANSPMYTQLDLDKSICDNLRDKVVIEYPTFIIILKENLCKYPMDDSGKSMAKESGVIDLPMENSVSNDRDHDVLTTQSEDFISYKLENTLVEVHGV